MTPSDEIAESDIEASEMNYNFVTKDPFKCFQNGILHVRKHPKSEYNRGFNAGFDQAIEMLRSFKDERNSLRIPAQHMSDWLENNKPRGVK